MQPFLPPTRPPLSTPCLDECTLQIMIPRPSTTDPALILPAARPPASRSSVHRDDNCARRSSVLRTTRFPFPRVQRLSFVVPSRQFPFFCRAIDLTLVDHLRRLPLLPPLPPLALMSALAPGHDHGRGIFWIPPGFSSYPLSTSTFLSFRLTRHG